MVGSNLIAHDISGFKYSINYDLGSSQFARIYLKKGELKLFCDEIIAIFNVA